MSYLINNNALEVSSPQNKRKRSLQCSNVYMNPALDLLSTEDAMCNTLMEVKPAKRTRRSRSVDNTASFENPALDTAIRRRDIYGLLRKELSNVNDKLPSIPEVNSPMIQNNSNLYNDVSMEEKTVKLHTRRFSSHVDSTPMNTKKVSLNTSFDLSFIEKLGIDDDVNGEALYLDDDLNESNIMEIKTITIVTKKNKSPMIKTVVPVQGTNPFLNCVIDYDAIEDAPIVEEVQKTCKDFPFDLPVEVHQPFTETHNESAATVSSYDATSDITDPETTSIGSTDDKAIARRLFNNDTLDGTSNNYAEHSVAGMRKFGHSTLNDQINCNFSSKTNRNGDVFMFGHDRLNKQSKILGCDVTNISRNEIFNERCVETVGVFKSNRNNLPNYVDNDIKCHKNKDKHGNKISSKIFSKIKDVFKHEKKHNRNEPVAANPYEVIRKPVHQEKAVVLEPVCFENPALNLNNTETEFQEDDDDSDCLNSSFVRRNPYEITPMKHNRNHGIYDKENYSHMSGVDLSDVCYQPEVSKKQVRFDSTLNHEKIITGNSFDSEQSSSYTNRVATVETLEEIDCQIDDYHNELENCFNEKKFITQNL